VLTLSPAVRIYRATGATDLRCSIDGLAALVRERFDLDPLSGHLFLFRNRRGDRLKILAWDLGGFWVLYKRPLHREASDGPEATHAKAAHGAHGTATAHACATGRTAPVVVQPSPWALSLLRFAEQRSGIGRFLP
jgi:hypothetical protein